MKMPRNVVGPQIMKLRYEQKLSQPELAARCQRLGWNIGRDTIAKIEDQRRWVGDFELIGLSSALRVPLTRLFPHKELAMRLLGDR
jgi:transcriptional regulator with XRE-family HTH domain